MLTFWHQFLNNLLVNSAPLSTRIKSGLPRSVIIPFTTSTTLSLNILLSASAKNYSMVNSTMMFNILTIQPMVNASLIKSILQLTMGLSCFSYG